MSNSSSAMPLSERERLCREFNLVLGSSTCLSSPLEVAQRVLLNMCMDLSAQADLFGPLWPRLLRVPLPYDSANPFKPALMPELMPPAGGAELMTHVWGHLALSFNRTAQATPIVLVTGVSGVGKTKVAYDIGLRYAFTIISRVVERDMLTAPWQAFAQFAARVVSSRGDCITLKAVMMMLLTAHLEWAVIVSEAAVSGECAASFDATVRAMEARGMTSSEARTRVLRELVLRAQRNGLAYVHVRQCFSDQVLQALSQPDAISDEGRVQISTDFAKAYLQSVARRACAVWASGDTSLPEIVWAHDEAQALLCPLGLPLDVFDGVYVAHAAEADSGDAHTRPRRGCFYGLLATIREMLSSFHCGHLLLGNNLDLSSQMLQRHSPAQGLATEVDKPVNLSVESLRAWLAEHLTVEAMTGVEDDALARLRGRAMFVSQFWPTLQASCRTAAAGTIPASLVKSALDSAFEHAVGGAEQLIHALWEKHPPSPSGHAPSKLMPYLYYCTTMQEGRNSVLTTMPEGVRVAIEAGVLNVSTRSGPLSLTEEAPTFHAITRVGAERTRRGNDGVLQLLAERVTSPPGGERSDYGPVLEDCFAWKLVHDCIRSAGRSLLLSDLLKPFFARDTSTSSNGDALHPGLVPTICTELEVSLDRGFRCDADRWEAACPLSLLVDNPTALLHHTRDSMGGADCMLLATHRISRITVPVLFQLKNRATGSISDALRSLNMGTWYSDNAAGETPAHRDLRRVLAEKPEWSSPVRVVVGAKSVHPDLLRDVAWFNRHQLAQTPVLLLQVTSANLGVPVAAPAAAGTSYGRPRASWPAALLPLPIRHWDTTALPALPALPMDARVSSLRVRVTYKGPREALEAAANSVTMLHGGAVTLVRHRVLLGMLGGTRSATATFTSAMAAFSMMEGGERDASFLYVATFV